jgi:four helix bundle protein
MYIFENLDLYKKAIGFAAVVEFATESFPPSTDYFTDRLNKSATSIPYHVAEAHGHWKDEERRGFFWKAREATQECSGLLDIAARQGLISEGIKISFRNKLDQLQNHILDAIRLAGKKDETPPEMAGPFGLRIV